MWGLGLLVLAGCDGVLHLEPVVVAKDATIDDSAPVVNGLVAHYTFETVDAPCAARDVTGRGHDAACQTTAPTIVPGPPGHGNAFRFYGTQYLIVPHSAELDSSQAFTVAVWANPAAFPDQNASGPIGCIASRPLVEAGTQGYDSWQLCMAPADNYIAVFTSQVRPPPTSIGTWTHLAVTWDGTLVAGYQGGALVDAIDSPTPAFDGQGIWIGADNDGTPSVHFDGAIDDLYIYNRVLGQAEVAALAM